MATVLYFEIKILTIAVLLVIAVKSSVLSNKRNKRKFFRLSLCGAIAGNIIDAMCKILMESHIGGLNFSLYMLSVMYFASLEISTYFAFLYSEAVLRSRIFKCKKDLILSSAFVVIGIVLPVISVFNECVFGYERNGVYHRGTLYRLQLTFSYIYIIAVLARNIVAIVKKDNYAHHEEMFNLAYISLLVLICGIIQNSIYGVSTMAIGSVMAYLLAYVGAVQTLISVDTLTGISNRREFLQRLDDRISSLKKNENLFFLFIDIDSFKQINDMYGHTEGDRVLKNVADILKNICNEFPSSVCARYGGDEFAVMYVSKEGGDAAPLIQKIYKNIELANKKDSFDYTMSISIGCSRYGGKVSCINDLVIDADENMYNEKSKKISV